MEDLLRKNEKRRLEIAEALFEKNDWMTLNELAKKTGSSIRNVKYDLDVFKEYFEDFDIHTSHKGVRIHFHRNKSLRTLYSSILAHSVPFQLLEEIFFNEQHSTFELADLLFISPSTLYRMIEHINEVVEKHGVRVETNPCRIIGDEEKIRHFYYKYFYEKYIYLDWSDFEENEVIDNLLHFFVLYTKVELDFALYGIFKGISTINYVRYKNKHKVKVDESKINLEEILPNINVLKDSFDYFEQMIGIQIDRQLIIQLFKPFIEMGYSLDYERLMAKKEKQPQLAAEVDYLDHFLEKLAADHRLPLPNKEEIIFGIQNARHMEKYDPRMGYILYDRNQLFALDIKEHFPAFYTDLCQGLKKYRKICSLPNTEDGLNYLVYITYSYWKGLTLNLRKKHRKIKVLVISNRHTAHSYMLKDFIDYEFNRQLEVDVYHDPFLTTEILEKLPYDFIVTNFPLPSLESKDSICIESIPSLQDLSKIQKEINRIKKTQTTESTYTK